MSADENLKNLDIKLPKANDPVGSYAATRISGNLLYISGQISIDENGNLIKGKLGKDYNTEQGYEAAKRCALSIISQAKKACGDDLSKIKSCLKLTGYVNSTDDFTEQPKVINGASDLIIIHTEWNEFKQINFKKITKKRNFKVFDMRNLYSTSEMKKNKINYFSIGR